ncbi:MAG: hypothetical protein R2708_26155 [Vicinamibacterales bacterium]
MDDATSAALDELNEFRLSDAAKVYGPMVMRAGANMTQAMAMYPQMKDALAKFSEESKKLNGTPLLTEMMFIAVASPEAQAQQAQGGGGQPPSLGGCSAVSAASAVAAATTSRPRVRPPGRRRRPAAPPS